MLEHNTCQASIELLDEDVATLTHGHAELKSKLKSIMDRLATPTIPHPSPKTPPTPPPVQTKPHMKLDVPIFDGQDPLDWIFKIQQFFDYQFIPEAERLTATTFYTEGPALSWYQWMYRNGFLTSWSAML